MKKHFFFLLMLFAVSTTLFAQAGAAKPIAAKKPPHLTFSLENDNFYYIKGLDSAKQKIELLDSSSIATIINAAIKENKVSPKNLNVILQGDDLMQHPRFEILLDTILSKTVSEVRLKTNVFE